MIHVLIESTVLPDPSQTQQASKITLKDFSIEGTNLQLGMEICSLLKKLEDICPTALALALQMMTDKDLCNIIELNS